DVIGRNHAGQAPLFVHYGQGEQVVLVEQFGDAVLPFVHGHLDQRLGAEFFQVGAAGGDEQPRQRNRARQAAIDIDQEQRVQRFQQVFVAPQRGQRIHDGCVLVQRDVLGVHHAAGGVFLELQQLLHFGLGRGVHLVEDFLGGLLLELGEDVGSL